MSEITSKKYVEIEVGDKEYICRVACDDYAKEEGLMYEKNLNDNEGMIFVYEEPQDEISFWMKNTIIPLDIVFISPKKKVISVKQGEPESTDLITEYNVLYVLEVNQGSGIQPGDKVDLDDLEDYLIDKLEDYSKEPLGGDSYLEDKIKSVKKMIYILDSNGDVQYELNSGEERVFSRKNTKVLIRQAKKANASKANKDYKRLGKSAFKYIRKQDENEPEFVNVKE